MLQSHTMHQWSVDGVNWVDVKFHVNSNGGSESRWPQDEGGGGDKRAYLSFWGDDGLTTGGCCSSSTAIDYTHPSLAGNKFTFWGQSFTLNYLIGLPPPPPNTGMVLVADVAGTTYANNAYWAEACKKIPKTSGGITVDMGAVRFFTIMACVCACVHAREAYAIPDPC